MAEELALGREEYRIVEWLKERAVARGEQVRARDLAERLFRRRPTLQGYRELRGLSEPERWSDLRGELLTWLKQKDPSLRVEVHLDEGEIDAAIQALIDLGPRDPRLLWNRDLPLRVARAAEPQRPRQALEICRREAQGLIGGRKRHSYREACRLLVRVRSLHERLGEAEAWSRYIAELVQSYRRFRALQEELRRAGLVE